MALSSYSTGTVAIAAGATAIIGAGTIWSGVNARAGDRIVVAGHEVTILDVTDETHLVIDPWPFAAVPAGSAYKIYQVSPLRFAGAQAMADVSTLVAALNKEGFFHFVGAAEAAPDPSLGDEGQYARQPATGKEWLKLGGVWVYQGISGTLSFDAAPWSIGTTYAQRVIVPRAGRLWMSLQGSNTGHAPESGPTWWQLFLSGGDAYDVVTFDTDRPDSAEEVLRLVFTKSVTFYSGLTDSRASADVAATASAVYSYRKNGVQFATLTFGAGSANGAFASTADTTFNAGDVMIILAPAVRDATLSGVAATLSGYRAN